MIRPSATSRQDAAPSPARAVLAACRPHLMAAALFSAVVNILYLTPTIFMMQVYDRVLPSGGLATLGFLSLVTLVGLATLGVLEWLRTRVMVRASARIDSVLAGSTLAAVLGGAGLSRTERVEGMRQFDTFRQGIAGPGVMALLDLPWTPIYLAASFLLHPLLGVLNVAAVAALLALAWSNERATHRALSAASAAAAAANARQAHASSHAGEIRALGLLGALVRRQLRERGEATALQTQASFAAALHGGLIRSFRLVLQSGSMALGAWLVVDGSLSGGAMIATSLLLARALAPIEQIVGGWKGLIQTREAFDAVDHLVATTGRREHTRLPDPVGAIGVEGLTVLAPDSDRATLSGLTFRIDAGEIVGVVGLSGAGKTTLLRTLAGANAASAGVIRIDGADTRDWDPALLARHIGYAPQDPVLFTGTVKENIARFAGERGGDAEAIDQAVMNAARRVGAHDMILRLPMGYDTPVGVGGVGLSAGQAQRVSLVRALYGEPRILVLDEPNAHLDVEGEQALRRLLSASRGDGLTIVLAAHSGDLLASVDRLMLLEAGRLKSFGPLRDVVPATANPTGFVPMEKVT